MPPSLLLDLSEIDLNTVMYGVEEIEAINPQRGHMRQLDAIVYASEGYTEAVGYKDVRDDEFWVDGHIPGRPIYPGVLMCEAAAQLAAWMMKVRRDDDVFIGFDGMDEVKFRAPVTPGQRLILLGRQIQHKNRRFVCAGQGMVAGSIVFEAVIRGMPV